MGQVRTEKTEINGIEVSCTQFSVMQCLALLPRVAKFVAASGSTHAQAAVVNALSSMSGDQIQELFRDVLRGSVARVGKGFVELASYEDLNAVFNGDLQALIKAFSFAIKVNYANFKSGASGTKSDSDASAPTSSESP